MESLGRYKSAVCAACVGLTIAACAGAGGSAAPSTSTLVRRARTSSSAAPSRSAPATGATPSTVTATTRVAPVSDRSYAVISEDWGWVDGSRSTVPYRGSAARYGRALSTRLFIPAVSGVAAVHDGPFPLFVWAHGLDATVDYFDPLLRAIAARGYVVAAPTFPLTRAGLPGGADFNDYVNQPGDVSFVIDQILAIDGPHGTERPGLVDPTRVAVGGHSLGAVTTMGLVANRCCIDARVKAAIEIDGSWLSFPDGAKMRRGVPLLLIHGDEDMTFSVNESRGIYAASSPPKYLVVLHGMPHTPFRIPAAYAIIAESVGFFLDAYLKHTPNAVHRLLGDADVPGLTTLTSAP